MTKIALYVLRLRHAEPVAEGIFENCFYSVELVRGRRKKFHAFGLEFFVRLAAIGGLESARTQCPALD
jgi:hypothetical protein